MSDQTLQIERHKKMQADFLASLKTDRLADKAKSYYQLAQKALVHVNTLDAKRYWQGYQDALQDVLKQARLIHQ